MAKASQIVLGTMRMGEAGFDAAGWAAFLGMAHRLGIRSLHSSSEYESFPLFCEALAILRSRSPDIQFCHVAKLAAPSFDDEGFDPVDLFKKLDDYRTALGSDVIHVVQWMWRKDLQDENNRLALATKSFGPIAEAACSLRSKNLIERFFCFPYTEGFAALAAHEDIFDGLIVYRNDEERTFDSLIDLCAQQGKSVIVIRPFGAGKLLGNSSDSAKQHLDRTLAHPAIESAILSSGNLAHLGELID